MHIDIFLEKSYNKHGLLYDYDNIINNFEIKIKCKIHGFFTQNIYKHINGRGCSKCKGGVKLTINDLLEKSNKIHNNIYCYKKVNYINSKSKVIITCNKHGDFKQIPSEHIKGQGCPICAGNIRLTTKEFIDRSNKIHNNLYDYSLSNYINNNTKISIICSSHGEFNQIPYNHLSGKGCPICAGNIRLTTKEFIDRSNKIHNNLYDYSLSKYINNNTKISIICSSHGIFLQNPSHHMKGSGCSKCIMSKGELSIINYLDKLNVKYISQMKFNDCKDKNKLEFDFYLIDKNILIEYDGIQHFKEVENWGGINKLKDNIKKDNIKNKYCYDNKIKLIRIPYWEYNNIEKIIDEIF